MIRCPKRLRYGFVLLAGLASGCGWFGGGSPLASNDSLLRYVPGDTPYVVAAVEPLPDEIVDLYAQQMASFRNAMQRMMQAAIEESPDPGSADRQFMETLIELTSPETIEATGLSRDSEVVVYGHGILPVFRVTLAEGHDFEGVLDRLEALIELEGAVVVETATVAGQAYRYLAADQARLIAALLENELVLTAVPTSFGEAELQSVLGLVPPEQSIADSGRLEAIADEYGFMASFVGLLDVERVAATFLDEATGTDAVLLDLMGYQSQSLSDACRDDFRALAGVVPSIVTGYTELSASTMAMSSVVELRRDIAEGLARIPASIPGMGAATDALISFGLSFDMPAVREFVAARLDAIEADPFECEALAGLQQSAPSMRMYLNQPLPPMVDSITGLSATVDFSDLDFASGGPMPRDVEMSMVVATDDASGILAMASALDPQIASLGLRTDGQIVELDLPIPFPDPSMASGPAFVAATETQIGFGLGRNGRARLEALMSAPPGDPSTFLSMGIDLAAYYGLLADFMENSAGQPGPVPAPAAMSSLTEMMRSMQAVYSRETVDVKFTERGIEIPVRFGFVQ